MLFEDWNGKFVRTRVHTSMNEDKNDATIVPLEGEIDLHVSPRTAATMQNAMQDKPARLVIDLSKVTYIDSSGLAVLIESMQSVEKYGGRFALAALQPQVTPIFEIARLDQVFKIFPDVDSAVASA